MTEKRFKSTIDEETMSIMPFLVSDNEEECFYNLQGCVDLLNEQQDTIRKLQDLCGESDGENAKLRIENKELQEEIKLLKPVNVEQYEQIVQLQEENEQLRKTMNEVIELLVEEVDLFSDKATEHDIIAYNEMNDFDNKDAYYMCISTKKAIKILQRCVSDE